MHTLLIRRTILSEWNFTFRVELGFFCFYKTLLIRVIKIICTAQFILLTSVKIHYILYLSERLNLKVLSRKSSWLCSKSIASYVIFFTKAIFFIQTMPLLKFKGTLIILLKITFNIRYYIFVMRICFSFILIGFVHARYKIL